MPQGRYRLPEDKEMSTQQELRKLVEDVYQQGYICGITDGRWFDAYAQMALEIVNDEMLFDYKLRKGNTTIMNASFLMKKMGIIK